MKIRTSKKSFSAPSTPITLKQESSICFEFNVITSTLLTLPRSVFLSIRQPSHSLEYRSFLFSSRALSFFQLFSLGARKLFRNFHAVAFGKLQFAKRLHVTGCSRCVPAKCGNVWWNSANVCNYCSAQLAHQLY